MDFWDAFPEIKILGIHRTRETRRLPALIEKNNIKVGFLAYTYGTNYIPIPADKPYLVSLINRRIMEEEINALRPLCDFLVVSMHWGEEYFHNYSREQENLAAFLAEHKVDMVIGHHPHVIQPAEYIMRPDGRYMLCFYSLGNLISAMNRPPTILGAMAYVKIKKIPSAEGEEADSFMFMDAGAIPLVTHFENNFIGFKIYPLYTYTVELAARHRINRERNELTMKYLSDLSARIFGGKEILRNPFD
jgi:poly-gamma-glutamate synthesis protein (capsule biosynthesis protein)